jgi:hypothetical protein
MSPNVNGGRVSRDGFGETDVPNPFERLRLFLESRLPHFPHLQNRLLCLSARHNPSLIRFGCPMQQAFNSHPGPSISHDPSLARDFPVLHLMQEQ